MGKGNPESADAIFAREPDIFVADKLSEKNKAQADNLKVEWVQLREHNGYLKFLDILKKLNVPYSKVKGNLDERLNIVLETMFDN